MGNKSSKDALGAVGKTDALQFDPDDLVIVTDPKHPLYDERHDPNAPGYLPLDENSVRNVMTFGVLETILVRKEGAKPDGTPIVVVADGRSRVRWAREANKRLREQGAETIRVPAFSKRGDDASLMGMMITANEVRKDDGPLVKAKKVQRFLNLGRSEEEAAVAFGVSGQTIKNYLALLECSPAVQSAVERGEIAATVAKKLSSLPRDEQKSALDKMREQGATRGKRAAAAAAQAKGETTPTAATSLGKKSIAGIASRLREAPLGPGWSATEAAALALEYAIGKSSTFAEFAPWHATGEGPKPGSDK